MSDRGKKVYNNIEKSKSDKFDCQIRILPNGLKGLLVSDPEAEQSSASLGVNVGSYIDLPDEMGLAHFCEHLLFMGTEKYPSENDYEEYISKNGGNYNAYTVGDKTVFYFNVNHDAFEGAVDRFAHFFICPLFHKGSVEREINAVDSEFSKNKNSDSWRFSHLLITQLNKDSPLNKFSTGNKQTLCQPDIRDRLLKMYKKYYSSEIMNLVLYSKLPMDNLIKLTDDLFTKVPKMENFTMPKYDEVKPFDENNLGLFYKIIPVKDEDSIKFIWYLPFCDNYYAKPLSFLSSLFGHEGENTLTASLKRHNLITDLITSKDEYAKTFSVFKLEVKLTKKGMDNYKEIILRVLKYIKAIQEKPINKRYFNEIKNMAQINFDFKNKSKPLDLAEKYAGYLIEYKPEDIFIGKYLYKEYNEELIKKYLDLLNMDNLNIYFMSKSLEKECNLTEPIYGTKYTKDKLQIKKEEVDAYKCEHIFDYPPVNKFIPKNLDIFPIRENPPIYPEKIMDEPNCKVWFLQDNIFKLPKGKIKANFKFIENLCHNSKIKNMAIAKLLKKIIKLELNEFLYLASEANAKFKVKIYFNRLELFIEGYNDSLKDGLEEILKRIKNMDINPQKHKELLELLIKEYIKKKKNFFYNLSYKVGVDYLKRLLTYPNIDLRELIDFLSNSTITIDDLISFKNNMLLETQSKWLIQGNFEKNTALEIVKMTNEILNIDIKKKIMKSFFNFRTVQLSQNINYIYRFLNPNKEEKDSTILSVIQCCRSIGEESQYFRLLCLFLSNKFYDILRTKEALGYIVSLTSSSLFEILHIVGIIQSSVKSPEYCSSRIRNFFKEKEKDIKGINDEEFKSLVKSRLVNETKKDRDLKEQFDRNWTEISLERFKFNIKEENAELLQKCTKEGFIKFYEKYFINEIRKLDIEYVCEAHNEENEKNIAEEVVEDRSANIKKRIAFDNIYDFYGCNTLYPCVAVCYNKELLK